MKLPVAQIQRNRNCQFPFIFYLSLYYVFHFIYPKYLIAEEHLQSRMFVWVQKTLFFIFDGLPLQWVLRILFLCQESSLKQVLLQSPGAVDLFCHYADVACKRKVPKEAREFQLYFRIQWGKQRSLQKLATVQVFPSFLMASFVSVLGQANCHQFWALNRILKKSGSFYL